MLLRNVRRAFRAVEQKPGGHGWWPPLVASRGRGCVGFLGRRWGDPLRIFKMSPTSGPAAEQRPHGEVRVPSHTSVCTGVPRNPSGGPPRACVCEQRSCGPRPPAGSDTARTAGSWGAWASGAVSGGITVPPPRTSTRLPRAGPP